MKAITLYETRDGERFETEAPNGRSER